jgi:hypothetical protein
MYVSLFGLSWRMWLDLNFKEKCNSYIVHVWTACIWNAFFFSDLTTKLCTLNNKNNNYETNKPYIDGERYGEYIHNYNRKNIYVLESLSCWSCFKYNRLYSNKSQFDAPNFFKSVLAPNSCFAFEPSIVAFNYILY